MIRIVFVKMSSGIVISAVINIYNSCDYFEDYPVKTMHWIFEYNLEKVFIKSGKINKSFTFIRPCFLL